MKHKNREIWNTQKGNLGWEADSDQIKQTQDRNRLRIQKSELSKG